jgi:hypothetical protein
MFGISLSFLWSLFPHPFQFSVFVKSYVGSIVNTVLKGESGEQITTSLSLLQRLERVNLTQLISLLSGRGKAQLFLHSILPSLPATKAM